MTSHFRHSELLTVKCCHWPRHVFEHFLSRPQYDVRIGNHFQVRIMNLEFHGQVLWICTKKCHLISFLPLLYHLIFNSNKILTRRISDQAFLHISAATASTWFRHPDNSHQQAGASREMEGRQRDFSKLFQDSLGDAAWCSRNNVAHFSNRVSGNFRLKNESYFVN